MANRHRDVVLDYVTYSQVGASLTLDYGVRGFPAADLVIDYAIYIQPGRDLVIDNEILFSVSASLVFDAQVHAPVGASLVSDYAISGATTISASLTFDAQIMSLRAVVIRYAGTDITAHCSIPDCEFTSMANGGVGTAIIRFRDEPFEFSFVEGAPVELWIEGVLCWAGYCMKIGREYAFDYEDRSVLDSKPRFFRLIASDINILFDRRYTFNKSNPIDFLGPLFTANDTPDIDAIRELCDNWLDLSGDDLDTVSMVEHVGSVNIDQPNRPFGASWKWSAAMNAIALLPAAVYYLTPSRKLVYTDVGTASNPMVLSDRPSRVANGVGYRSPKYGKLGEAMTNDYLAWGVGQGSASAVFDRVTDAASVAEHGRWQDATINYGVYKQATIDKVAESVIYGSPSSHRGAKDDRVVFECIVDVDGFHVADKVRTMSDVYGLDEVIPIRKIRTTFIGTGEPRYELTLSHAIDAPWSFFDIVKNPQVGGPGGPTVTPPVIGPGGGQPPGGWGNQPKCDLLDGFGRDIGYFFDPRDDATLKWWGGGWGHSDHLDWGGPIDRTQVLGEGLLECRPPQYVTPDFFGYPGSVGVSATLPEGVHNLLIRFAIEPRETLVYGGGVTATSEAAGDWTNPAAATDFTPPDNFGQTASIAAGVSTSGPNPSGKMQLDGGGGATKTIILGDIPTDSAGVRQSYLNGGPWFPSCGGGIVANQHLWFGSGAYREGDENDFYWRFGTAGGYYGGVAVREILWAKPGFNDDIKLQVAITVGGHRVLMTRDGPGVSSVEVDGVGTPSPGSIYLYPGSEYFLRFFNPNPGCSFVKVWSSASPEPADWTASNGAGCTDIATISGAISIVGTIYDMQSYAVAVRSIWSCDTFIGVPNDFCGLDCTLPWTTVLPPAGSDVGISLAPGFVLPDGTIDPTAGLHTISPYQPGSLFVWVNGTLQRKGVDYAETNPAAGLFTLLFTPLTTDKIFVRYIGA